MTQTTDRCTECHEYIGDHKLIRRTLITRGWNSKPEPHGDYYLTIRIADEESR